jgi:hypothetical protein
MWEYQRHKGFDKPREVAAQSDVSNHDLLMALLLTGECLFSELRAIRNALEDPEDEVAEDEQD